MAFADALRALNAIKADGVVEEYAIAGAMAMVFWSEPVPTFDLDVLVVLPGPQRDLISLDAIYRWAESNGYPVQHEHILVEGLPIQLMPAPSGLAREAITSAVEVDYQGVLVRVVRLEYSKILVERLRTGKAALHAWHASLPLPEKVRLVMELQRIVLPLVARQRPLRSWERPWIIEP
jgi:hypothetical protein